MAGKADIVDQVAGRAEGLSKKQVAEAFDAIFDAIIDHLKKGERVQITGFGSLSVSERAARKGRNPATGQSINIPASRNARFKPSKDLKDQLSKGGRKR
jgi:DNA-binding protein HU-beta